MTALPKYTDEQLSMILSEAAAGRLGAPGKERTWCVEQVASGEISCGMNDRVRSWDAYRGEPHLVGDRNDWGGVLVVSLDDTLSWLRREGLL